MYCNKCGTALSDKVKYCPKCGAAVKNVEAGQKNENFCDIRLMKLPTENKDKVVRILCDSCGLDMDHAVRLAETVQNGTPCVLNIPNKQVGSVVRQLSDLGVVTDLEAGERLSSQLLEADQVTSKLHEYAELYASLKKKISENGEVTKGIIDGSNDRLANTILIIVCIIGLIIMVFGAVIFGLLVAIASFALLMYSIIHTKNDKDVEQRVRENVAEKIKPTHDGMIAIESDVLNIIESEKYRMARKLLPDNYFNPYTSFSLYTIVKQKRAEVLPAAFSVYHEDLRRKQIDYTAKQSANGQNGFTDDAETRAQLNYGDSAQQIADLISEVSRKYGVQPYKKSFVNRCDKCGTILDGDAIFCPSCGNIVDKNYDTGRFGKGSAGGVSQQGNHNVRNVVLVVLFLLVVLIILLSVASGGGDSSSQQVDTSNYTVLYDNQYDSNGYDKWWFMDVGTFTKGLFDTTGVTFDITYREVYTDIDYDNETKQAGYIFYVSAYSETGNASANKDDMRGFNADDYTEKNGSTRVYTNSSGDELTVEVSSWMFGALTDVDLTLETHDGYYVYWTTTTS